MASAEPQIILYRRAECSACDRAVETVRSIAAALDIAWSECGVESDPVLERRYAARVPVVALQSGAGELELAAERIDAGALARRLRAALSDRQPD